MASYPIDRKTLTEFQVAGLSAVSRRWIRLLDRRGLAASFEPAQQVAPSSAVV